MNAIVLAHHGGPEVLQLSEIAVPRPEQHQVLIKHAAIGVNTGTLAIFGLSSGNVPPFDINRMSGITGASSKGSLFLAWPTLNDHTAKRADLLWRARAVFEAVGTGQLQTHIADILPLAEAAQAHRSLEERRIAGKFLLRP